MLKSPNSHPHFNYFLCPFLDSNTDHIEYIKQTIGVNHIGIGSDFGGTRL